MTRRIVRDLRHATAAALLMASASAPGAQTAAVGKISIEPQSLASALRVFSEQSGLQVGFAAQLARDLHTQGIKGSLSHEEALSALLRGTNLEFRFVNDKTVVIRQRPLEQTSDAKGPARTLRLVQSTDARDQSPSDAELFVDENNRVDATAATSAVALEEVIVTGSQIRGVQPVGAPLIVIGREEIQRSGFSSVRELMESLPQAYGGDASEDVFSTKDDAANASGSVGVNLRGLNASSTLTLLNGRRMALAGGFGAGFADISTLPLSAIERVEILTDGASAIYGSDAIAGVVNFILRSDYEGAETRVRYGSVTSGAQDEVQLAQTFGKRWGAGNLLVSYEFHDRGRLRREDRSYSATRDLRPFGGTDFSSDVSRPGNLYFARLGFPAGQDGTNLTPDDLGPMNTESRVRGQDFIGASQRHSVFVTGEQALTDAVALYGELRYSTRDYVARAGELGIISLVSNTHPNFVSPTGETSEYVTYSLYDEAGAYMNDSRTKVASGVMGARWDFGAHWQGHLYLSYARDKTRTNANGIDDARLAEALGFDDPATPYNPDVDGYLNVFGDVGRNPQNVLDYILSGGYLSNQSGELSTANVKFDGPLWSTAAGEVKMALGGEYREESLKRTMLTRSQGLLVADPFSSADAERSVSAVFGEVVVPIFGAFNQRTGLRSLEISAALRNERYSDFGSSTDPKFGIRWEMFEGVSLRATYGTSFKAPRVSETLPQARNIVVGELFNPLSPTGTSMGMWLYGSGTGLKPETSTTWTAGADLKFAALPNLQIQATYFDIDFTDRIASVNLISAFQDQDYFAPVLTFDPDDDLVRSYLDTPYYTGPAIDPSIIEVIMDGSKRNIASTVVRGIDFDARYAALTTFADLSFGLNASYLIDFKNALVPGATMVEQVSTLDNPTDLRLRASVSAQRGALNAGFFLNYTNSYEDRVTSLEPRKVDSWTTLDLSLSYTVPRTQGWFSGTRVFLSANNLLDEDPPFVNNASPSMSGYDPANADPTGRFVSFSITKEWR